MVVNIYSLTQLGILDANGYPISRGPTTVQGAKILRQFMSYSIPTTTVVNDVWRLFKNVDANVIPIVLNIALTTTVTTLSVSAGIYKPNLSLTQAPASGGAAVLMASTSIATAAYASIFAGTDALAALKATTLWNVATSGDSLGQQRMLYQIAGDSLVESGTAAPNLGTPRQYDICVTALGTPNVNVATVLNAEFLYTLG